MHGSKRFAQDFSSIQSIAKHEPVQAGAFRSTAAPAPSESIQRRNSTSNPRDPSRTSPGLRTGWT